MARPARPAPPPGPDNVIPVQADAPDPVAARAAEAMLGPNPFVGLSGSDLLGGVGAMLSELFRHPGVLLEHELRLAQDLLAVFADRSDIAPKAGDKRFVDPAWQSNPFYRGLMQGHLAWQRALEGLVDHSGLQGGSLERARFAVGMLTDAFAPTNSLWGNPAALKKALDTGGASLVRGLRHQIEDLRTNGGMPAQVDDKAFEVGRDLAVTPGSVVYRNEVLELIQYRPVTDTVHARPHMLVPPQVNKYYVFDLSPGKSIAEHLVKDGFHTFVVSWRNPTPVQRDWNMDTYVAALLDAIRAVCAITGSPDVILHGACSGAMTMAALMGHLAAIGEPLVHAATLMVAVLDNSAGSQLGTFITPQTVAAAKERSAAKGVLDGRDMGRVFAWMRPNDLVWNYWVSNYLMGNPPPAFDVLFWNNDSTRLSAAFHAQLLEIFTQDRLVRPGGLEVLGTPIDLATVTCDKYVVAGITDHITPWKGVYRTSRVFGGDNTFVLSSSGHIQSLVNPPGNPKSKFLINAGAGAGANSASAKGASDAAALSADDWLAGAGTIPGSWWVHWSEWLRPRSGERVAAPKVAGNKAHPALQAAPGRYVLEP